MSTEKEHAELNAMEQEMMGLKPKKKKWFSFGFFNKGAGKGPETDPYGLTEDQRKRLQTGAVLYEKAVRQLTKDEKWEEASETYERNAKCLLFLGKRSDAATCLISAGNCLLNLSNHTITTANKQKLPPEEIEATQTRINTYLHKYIEYCERAIDEALCGGYFHQAASYMTTLSKFVRNPAQLSTHNLQKSIELLLNASKVYFQNNDNQHAINCLTNAAIDMQKEHDFDGASKLWLQCAEYCIDIPVMRLCAVKYQTSFVLCVLAAVLSLEGGDDVYDKARDALTDMQTLDPQFTPSRREAILLDGLIDSCENHSPSQLTSVVAAFSSTLAPEPEHRAVLTFLKTTLCERYAPDEVPDKGKKGFFKNLF
eukprot:TRINITY_DN7511_c0_g1_i1.p1 TRINITY_DN7511_c0_g1~~TRINITY_DN7511_c0_g1_i1.p1  ORF type:complete len:390 (+),score=77.40 TRINITY_DN7511_c0_g1_i1:65-1171(+)